MRCLLLAFALGVLALQQQAELPSAARAVWIALPLAIALLFYGVAIRASTGWRRRAASCGAVLSAAVAIGLGGFFYAAWRVHGGGRDVGLEPPADDRRKPRSAANDSRLRWSRC